MQEKLGLKVSQFTGIMGEKVETEEDRVLANNKASEYIDALIERLANVGPVKDMAKVANE